MRQNLRAAVIGLGVGERHIEGYEQDPRCKVTMICDINPQKLHEVGARHPELQRIAEPEWVLRDPNIDVVSVASYDNAHHDQVVLALQQGKHVFVEKPLCLTSQEFQSIAKTLAEHPKLQISSNLILRRSPRLLQLRDKIRQGELGDVYYLEGDYDYGRLEKLLTGWRGEIPFYSIVHGGAIHLIDLIMWLTQKRVETVFAWGNKIATQGTQFRQPVFVAALLRFGDTSLAKITANFASVTPHHHKLCVYGTAASFIQSHTGAAYLTDRNPTAPLQLLQDSYPGMAKGDMIPAFVSSILDGGEPDVTTQAVMDTMAVSLAIEQSLSSGQVERVQYAQR